MTEEDSRADGTRGAPTLDDGLTGRVIRPGDERYAAARTLQRRQRQSGRGNGPNRRNRCRGLRPLAAEVPW